MTDTIYSEKINDPKSKAVNPKHKYLVCKQISGRWHIVESHFGIAGAEEARRLMAEHDLINGHITDTSFWRVFPKDYVEIKETL